MWPIAFGIDRYCDDRLRSASNMYIGQWPGGSADLVVRAGSVRRRGFASPVVSISVSHGLRRCPDRFSRSTPPQAVRGAAQTAADRDRTGEGSVGEPAGGIAAPASARGGETGQVRATR